MMDHPNIARVIDGGATDTGRPYFVMDLVRGIPITDYCEKNRLPIIERLKLLGDVCSAVQHAHQKGIIHRDIKPSNVMVTSHDGRPVVKVIDFGIAKATHQRLTEKTLLTESRQFIGTPVYMSPEQAEMGGLDIDTRSDIYSLGVLLYELLTGTTPLDPTRLLSAGYGEIQRIIREEEPQRPSTRLSTMDGTVSDPTRRRDLKRELDWIVMKAIEKDRTRRYDTAAAFANDIERFLTDRPVEAGPPSTGYRVAKFVKRNRVPVIVSGIVVASLITGAILMGIGFVRAERQRKLAVAAQRHAMTQQLKAEQVARFLSDMLATAGPHRAQGRDTTLLRAILDTTLERGETELREQPEVRAQLFAVIGRTYRELALYAQAEKVIREALELRRIHLGRNDPATLESLGDLANVLLDQGKLADAEPIVRDVIARRAALLGPDAMSVAQAMNDLSYIHQMLGRLDDAEAVQRDALRLVRKNVQTDHADLAAALNQMARILNLNGKYDEAEKLATEGLEMRRRLHGDEHSDTTLSMETIAYSQRARGEYEQAEQNFRRIIEIRRRVFGEDHPETLSAQTNLGWILASQGKNAQAEAIFRETLATYEPTLGKDNPRTLIAMVNLASVLAAQGRFQEALPLMESAAEARRRVLGPNHSDTLDTEQRLEQLRLRIPAPTTSPATRAQGDRSP
jgi:tetratricopeptide (TPR) repeat protein